MPRGCPGGGWALLELTDALNGATSWFANLDLVCRLQCVLKSYPALTNRQSSYGL